MTSDLIKFCLAVRAPQLPRSIGNRHARRKFCALARSAETRGWLKRKPRTAEQLFKRIAGAK